MFFSVALLAVMPATSQDLVRNPDDPKVIFRQDFEPTDQTISADSAWRAWQTVAVDTIKEIAYYSKIGTSSVSSTDIYDGSPDWEIFAVRKDSIIPMFNGVETSTSSSDLKKNPFPYANDQYSIEYDGGVDAERNEAFAEYGENGGKYYFRYLSGDATGASGYSSSTASVSKYRRNMYVRGLDIEDESSYRLTFYIKARNLAKKARSPLFYADVMRGYHHQRAAFSMGAKSGVAFEYQKSSFTGDWEKVTFMTYYLNDSVAEAYTYYDSYQWADDWRWRPSDDELAALGKTLKEGDSLNYIVQPDKFFVRLAFSTDSVEYLLDNLTLTKSWIGGVEHYRDMIRVDFGYETNLKELAIKAERETGIAAIELDGQYFDVMGYRKASGKWTKVDINSAEYHDDGYMYMWTKPYVNPQTGKVTLSLFEVYDSVLVSFRNPDDESMRLNYTGKTYPKALDQAWVEAGKKVHNFTNELSTPNPNIGKGVYSMKNLPPKMVGAPYEDGSFGLDPINSITVSYTRALDYDDQGEASALGWLRVTKSGVKEIWTISESNDSTTTYVRSQSDINKGALSGDYKFEFVNIKGVGTDYADNVTLNYHFGDFSTQGSASEAYCNSDWRSMIADFNENQGCNPTDTYVHDTDSEFRKGDGTRDNKAKTRLYVLDYGTESDVDLDNCGYYLDSRSDSEGKGLTGNLYTIINFSKAGGYSIKFKVAAWDNTAADGGATTKLLFYPKPDGTLADGNSNGFKTFEDVENKTNLGSFNPNKVIKKSTVEDKSTGKWPDEVETFVFTFDVPTAGDYVFEWVAIKGKKKGVFIGNYFISSVGSTDLSTKYVTKLNDAIQSAEEKLEEADPDEYRGAAYDALEKIIEEGKNYKGNFPSKYDSVVAYINQGITALKLRMDTVDLFYTTENMVVEKLDEFEADDMVKYQDLDAYVTLSDHLDANVDWDCSEKTNAELTAEIALYEAEIKALDDRMVLIELFNDKATQIKAAIDAATYGYLDEYAFMKRTYDEVIAVANAVTDSDDVFQGYYNSLYDAYNGYVFKIDYVFAKTRQAKELFALADALGYDFNGDKDGYKAKVDALADDDAKLTEFLREAAILQIIGMYNEKDADKIDAFDGYDVSALISNYFLYNEADIDRDMEQNSNGKWRIKKGMTNNTAIPGWTVTTSSGDLHPSYAKIGEDNSWLDWEEYGHVFVGGLICSSAGAKNSIMGEISGLPYGYYWVGANVSNGSSGNSITLTATSGNASLQNKIGSVSYKDAGVDSLLVNGTLNINADYKISSTSSKELDIRYFKLLLSGYDKNHDYSADFNDQKSKVDALILFADAPVADQIGVQYFSLGGIQIDAPKAGEIVIKRTILSDGQVDSQIELIK